MSERVSERASDQTGYWPSTLPCTPHGISLSGSDETIVRLWKANASEKLGTLTAREKDAFKYSEKLKDKFAHHPQVGLSSKSRSSVLFTNKIVNDVGARMMITGSIS